MPPTQSNPIQRETYTLAEFAALMGLSYGHVYELAREGTLPGVIKLGRRWLVSRYAVDELLNRPASVDAQ
jgi:excisionase family DNA binding protein